MTAPYQIGVKKDTRNASWEDSDFPIVCETCLGDNPYLRMTKEKHGKECKVCQRPFTVFRWRPGPRARFKKTEVCQVCAKVKNVCQTCLLDLQFGLPVQVRDAAIPNMEAIPQSEANREYFADQAQRKLANGDIPWGKAPPSHMLAKLARTAPYYKRNAPHVCSFFLKGTCNRGSECPYRHEKPDNEDSDLSKQNIKDRYYGVNDPVANKMLGKAADHKLVPPTDDQITTLYIGGVTPAITEQDIRDKFYSFGEIKSVIINNSASCAFVCYTTRIAAEAAAEQLHKALVIKNCPLRLAWGKSTAQQSGYQQPKISYPTPKDAHLFALPPNPPPPSNKNNNNSSNGNSISPLVAYYPSMNPAALGSKPQTYAPADEKAVDQK